MTIPPDDPTANSWQQERPSAPHVPDYLVWSILATFFCCQPLGVAGIVYAAMANSKKNSADFAGALNDASMAKKLLWWSFGLGIAVWIAVLALYGFAALAAISTSP